ncbi:MAG: heavy-metal-associated domain-containing protein [Thermodesulfovibrionales bacterium]|nr:heavy-metal-associated domain-containing protein [Thermodesulfovibrionales bacterium]
MQKTIKIEGMSCQHCVKRVKNALEVIKGIKSLDVSIGEATLQFDDSLVDETVIKNAILNAGYKVVE